MHGQPDMSPRGLYNKLREIEKRLEVLEKRLPDDDASRALREELYGAAQIVSEIAGKDE